MADKIVDTKLYNVMKLDVILNGHRHVSISQVGYGFLTKLILYSILNGINSIIVQLVNVNWVQLLSSQIVVFFCG